MVATSSLFPINNIVTHILVIVVAHKIGAQEVKPEGGDSFYNFALAAATANLGSTRSLGMNDALPWVLAICFSALYAHSCSNVRFAILPRAAILSIMPKTY